MSRRWEFTIKTKLGLLATTLINTVLFFALITSGQDVTVSASNLPAITTSGLVVHLDASDSASYIGNGNQWVNLVDEESSYTIANGTFDAANSGSIVFNGSSTYVNLGTPLATNTSYTKEAWVKTDVLSGSRNIISTSSSPLFLSNSTLFGGVGVSYTVVNSVSFPAEQWKHVVLTFNHTSKSMTLYIDGIQVHQATATGKSFTSEIVRIGAHGHATTATNVYSFWDGNIAQVRIYNVDLDPSEVSENFHASKQAFVTLVDVDLSFDANQGQGSMDLVSAEEFSTITLPDNSFARTDFVFNGWNDQADGSGNAYSNQDSFTMSYQDTVLYAQWIKDSYTITYIENSGILTEAIDGYSYNSGTITLPTTITREYFGFDGWYTNSDFTGSPVTTFESSDVEDKTFYAKFTQFEFTINYDYGVNPNTLNNPLLYRALTIPHEKVEEDLVNFPLTVVLDDSNFDFTDITYSGIYFTDANNVLLDFEVDSVATSPNKVIYHVRVPFVSNTQDTIVKVYYSNEVDYSNGNNPSDVWDEYYIFVSHMGPGITNVASATPVTQINNITFGSGLLGDVAVFNQSNIQLPSSLTTTHFTKVAVFTTNEIAGRNINLITSNDKSFFFFNSQLRMNVGKGNVTVGPEGSITINNPHVGFSRYDENGSFLRLDTYTVQTPQEATTNEENISLGRLFNGTMDEVRISNIGRSNAWIKAEYLTLTNDLIEYPVINPLTYEETTETIILSNPGRIHSEFIGWFANADLVSSPVSSIETGSTGDLVLYAKWKPYRVIAIARPTIDDDNKEGFVLNGSINTFTSSGFTNSGITLTTSTNQVSSVFLDKQFSASADGGFSSYFVLDVREVDANPGDGFVFVIAENKNSLGAAGEGLGYGGISNSVGLEFDFYDNGSEPPIHIDLHQSGEVQNAGFNTIDTIDDWSTTDNRLFRRYHVWLDYDQATSGLSVYITSGVTASTNLSRPSIPTQTYSIDINSVVGDNYFVGFTASTAAAAAKFVVPTFYFSTTRFAEGIDVTFATYDEDTLVLSTPSLISSQNNDQPVLTISVPESSDPIFDRLEYQVNGGSFLTYRQALVLTSGMTTITARGVSLSGRTSSVESYTVSKIVYDVNNSIDEIVIITSGQGPITLKSASTAGPSVSDWYEISDYTGDAITSASYGSVTTVYGEFRTEFTVTFDKQSGTGGTDSGLVTFGQSMPSGFVAPTRAKHAFVGYYSAISGGTKYYDSGMVSFQNWNVTSDTTLYAQWSEDSYTISYVLNDGSLTGAIDGYSFTSGTITLPTTITREYYTFNGWFTSSDFTGSGITTFESSDEEDKTFYAKWVETIYSITYVLNEGTLTSPVLTFTYTSGTVTLPTTITRDYYTFNGWFDNPSFDGDDIDTFDASSGNDRTFYANWVEIVFSISYVLNSGTLTSPVSTYTITSGTITLPTTITREYYFFNGWYTNSDLSGSGVTTFDSSDVEDKIFYAKFNQLFSINYDYGVNPNTPTNPLLYRALTIPHAKVDEDLFNFPLTVVLDDSNFDFTGITYSGIYFTDANNVLLDFELDSVSTSPNKVIYHVRIPFVSNSQDTVIKVYYSNEIDYSNGNNPDDVWDANYIFVSHMGPGIPNSASSTGPSQINNITFDSGLLGDVATFDGGFIELPSVLNTDEFTKILLIRPSIDPSVVNFATSATDAVFSTNNKNLRVKHNNNFRAVLEISQQLVVNTRYFIANRFNSNISTIWLDDTSKSVLFGGNVSRLTSRANIIIGAYNTNGAEPFRGTMDEVRISNIGRSDAWIKAEYLTLTNDLIDYPVINPLTYEETTETTLSDPKRIHYDFDGWFANADLVSSPVSSIETGSTGDLILYAKWVETIYLIDYVLNSGILASPPLSTYTITSGTITLPITITRFVHVFDGWYDNASFEGEAITSFDASTGGDRTYYAKWIEDIVPPSVSLIGENEIVVEVGSSYTEAGITFSDNYSINSAITVTSGVTLAGSASVINPSVVGVYILTYTLVDENNNIATISRTIRVVDTTPPVISDISNQTIDASDADNFTTPIPTITDNSNLIQSSGTEFTSASGQALSDLTAVRAELRAGRNVIIVYTAVDPSDNTSSGTILITAIDNIKPVISGISSGSINASDAAAFTTPIPTITDNSETIASSGVTFFETSGMVELSDLAAVRQTLFEMRNVTIVYTAIDPSGNATSGTILITAIDNVKPVISNITDQTINASEAANFTTPIPTITDNSETIASSGIEYFKTSGLVELANEAAAIAELVATNGVTIRYTATDDSNNTRVVDIVIEADDDIQPVISGISSGSINASDAAAFTTPIPTITDNSETIASSGVTFFQTSGMIALSDLAEVRQTLFEMRDVTIVYTAIDPSGNTTSGTILITANDNVKPVISGISSGSINASDAAAFTTPIPTITDNSNLIQSSGTEFTSASGQTLSDVTAVRAELRAGRNVTIVYTADDPSGNTTSGTILITAIDNVKPVISGISSGSINASDAAAFTTPIPMITDNSENIASSGVTFFQTSGMVALSDLAAVRQTLFEMRSVIIRYTAIDRSGNTRVVDITSTPVDNITPTFSGLSAIQVTTPEIPDFVFPVPEILDNDPLTTVYSVRARIGTSNYSTDLETVKTALINRSAVSLEYTVRDAAGNETVASFSISVINFVPRSNPNVELPRVDATANKAFNFTYPTDSMIDLDLGETITYTSSGLPAGLTFDASTMTITGAPTLIAGASIEAYTVQLIATDSQNDSGVRTHVIRVFYTTDIAFVSNGGSAVTTQSNIIGQPLPNEPVPSRSGYTFDGWYTNVSLTTAFDWDIVMPQTDLTLNAQWAIINYPINYIYNIGNTGLKGSYTINEATHAFEPAQTIGRSFDGWFYDAGFTQPATQIIGGAIGAVTIYARWETFTYTVSYRADGKTIESFSVIFRTAVPSGVPAIPAKVGHVAVGWDSVAPAVMPARGIRINAVYEPLAFIMTFNDDEGSVLSSETLPFGSLVTYPEVPARVGFEFDSWSTTISSVPAQDFTVTAAYYALKYVVTFVDDLGAPIGSSEVVFNELVTLPTPPVREGFVFVEWTGLPALMPAAAVTVTGVYEAGAASQETDLNEESPIPAFPTSRPARPVIIPDVILGPNPEPVTTYVNINGTVLEISITPGQRVGELPDAVYAGYNFKGWMNGITGELILPDTIINNPDFVVLVPLFEKSPSLIDAARKVFQFNPLNALPQLIPTNDLTDRDDNIVSSRPQSTNGAQSVPLQGGLEAWINLDGTVTIPLPNERTPITLRVTGLDAASLSIHYVIGEDAPEFDHPSWLLYTGEPFLTNQPGQSVFMLVKDAFDTHQVSYLRPATFITNPERIPTSSLILSSQDSSELTNTKLHTFLTKIEYEDTMVDMFVIEPTEGNELQTVIVRYRANDHNKSLLLNVEAMTWREEFVAVGSSLGVYLRSGDNLEFEVEYQFNGQPSITEIFQISLEGESIGVFLATGPSTFLRVMLVTLILSTLLAPYLVNPKKETTTM